jgi:hypothetical protein
MKALDPSELRLLRAALDCIIPRDQDPGASDLDVDRFILKQLAGDSAELADTIMTGLWALDAEAVARFGNPFETLTSVRQNGLIAETQSQPWFLLLMELAAEGFYADPGNGGNRDALSWRMIGYEHRLPDGPSGPMRGGRQ